MFEDYREIQNNFYDTMIQSIIKNQKVNHAYFIETNGYEDSLNLAISFAKFLICTSHHTNFNDCKNCSICTQIDAGSYANFKLIEPDGLWIKKEQLLNLQIDFKTKSLDDHFRVYIINSADRLNKAAANSMLKFLEEPEENIIAILLAPHHYQVLKTIISRCQIFQLIPSFSSEKVDNEMLSNVVSFCMSIEESGTKTIAFCSQIWDNILNSKETLLEFNQLLLDLYESVLHYQLEGSLIQNKFDSYLDEIKKIAKKNSSTQLLNKMEILYKIPKKVQLNSNQTLLIDKLIIDLSGGVNA